MKDKFNWLYVAVICFLTCYFIELCNFPMFCTLIGSGILFLAFFLKQKTIRIDLGIILLIITTYSYYIIQYGFRAVAIMITYVPLMMYVMSVYLAGDFKGTVDWERKYTIILFTLIVGYAIHGILNSYMYYAGYIKEGTRQWTDFWTHAYKPATQHSLLYLPVLSVLFPAIMWFRKNKIRNIFIICLSVFFLYTSIVTKSRIPILIVGMIFCGEVILYLLLESKAIKKVIFNKKVWFATAGFLMIAIVVGYLIKDIELISNFIDSFSRGGGILHNVRFELQAKALKQLFDYPMGGRQMDLYFNYERQYIHNTWLDMVNASGIIPFFAFTAFTVYSVINLIRFLLKKEVSIEVKIITAGLYVMFFLFYSVEPAFDASINYISPWMLINGMIQGLLSNDGIKLDFLRSINEK